MYRYPFQCLSNNDVLSQLYPPYMACLSQFPLSAISRETNWKFIPSYQLHSKKRKRENKVNVILLMDHSNAAQRRIKAVQAHLVSSVDSVSHLSRYPTAGEFVSGKWCLCLYLRVFSSRPVSVTAFLILCFVKLLFDLVICNLWFYFKVMCCAWS